MAYSIDFRKKILDAYLNDEGGSQEIADRFKISISTVKRIGQRYRETGKVELYLNNIGHKTKVGRDGQEIVKAIVQERPDATLEEIRQILHQRSNILVTAQAIYYILKKMQLTYKKKSIYASQRDREDVKKKRRVYRKNG